jgi:AcrR family transcriptional regulator
MTDTAADEAARSQVLDAAGRLYYRRGIQNVGMDDLRAESGISLKRLYRLCPSKESIVEQSLLRQHETWNHWLESAIARAHTPRDRLLAIYDMLARWFRTDEFRGCLFINSFGELGTVTPRIAEIVRSHKAGFQSRVAQLTREAGAPAALAAQLAILAEGAQTTAAISGSPTPARQARKAAEVLIDAALRRPPAAGRSDRP